MTQPQSKGNNLSESVSCALDEIVYERTSCNSDPIGREHDLSSSGPLDEGIEPRPGSLRMPLSEQVNRVKLYPTHYHHSAAVFETPSRATTTQNGFIGHTGENQLSETAPGSSPIAKSTISANCSLGSPLKDKSGRVPNGRSASVAAHPSNASIWRSKIQANVDSRREDHVSSVHENGVPVTSAALARRNARSHTSQGIPNHSLRMLATRQDSIMEESNDQQDPEVYTELHAELAAYQDRVALLEEQVALLSLQNKEALAALNSTDAAAQLRNTLESWATGLALSPSTQLGSTPSLTTSPDNFSPYISTTPAASQFAFYKPQSAGLSLTMPTHNNQMSTFYTSNDVGSTTPFCNEQPYLMAGLHLNLASLAASNPQSPIVNGCPADGVEEKPSYPFFVAPASYDAHSHIGKTQNHRPPSATTTSGDAESHAYSNGSDEHTSAELLVSRAMSSRNQEASITLQQQLKTAPSARRAAIVRAIEPHVLELADDKHGNFLVQRAIGVDARLALSLKGHFVQLSLSQFGCHVVQRLLDEEESLRKMVIEELLSSNVYETLVCRNSIHIWQKILELHWSTNADMRSHIYGVVNKTMKGRWAETAMLETGSIICQNIFECANADEKHDCLREVLQHLCECACNQWGVWVVQHIIEHGESDVKAAAFDRLIKGAGRLTLSQYGQKAIMSALKSRDPTFVARYINVLCDREASSDVHGAENLTMASSSGNRRSLLVDVSTAPQGVQIVTQLLTSVTPEQRERIIKTVRKNSVFLKGSKAGLRVHQLCERARAFTGY